MRSPALAMTPPQLAGQITAASAEARRSDCHTINSAIGSMNQAIHDMQGLALADRTAREQNRWLYIFGGIGAVIGMMLWAIVPGIDARRIVPTS